MIKQTRYLKSNFLHKTIPYTFFHIIPVTLKLALFPTLTLTVTLTWSDITGNILRLQSYASDIFDSSHFSLYFHILSCQLVALMNAQPLPAHSPASDNSLIGCTSHEQTDDWSLPVPISLTACAHLAACLGAFFYWTRFIWQQCTVRQSYSDLSDQSVLEIRVRNKVRLKVAIY